MVDINNIEVVDHYASILEQVYVDPGIFLALVCSLLIYFIVRSLVWYNMDKSSNEKTKKAFKLYIFGHISLEYVIALLIGFILIKLTNANPDNYLINLIVSPAVGFLSGIYIVAKFIMPIEKDKNNNFSGNGSKDKNKGGSQEVKITVSSNDSNVKTAFPRTSLEQLLTDTNEPLSFNDLNDEEQVKKLNKVMNESTDIDKLLANEIQNINKELGAQSAMLKVIRHDMLITKKYKVKKMIYRCLEQGFATPEQDERLRDEYDSYRALGGNSVIQDLFENKYEQLPVHPDRRTSNIPVEQDRRKNNDSVGNEFFDE